MSKKDHPRRCGENSEPAGKTIVNAGSPPQVRGKHNIRHCHGHLSGITPAGAGKTGIAVVGGVAKEDHPRRCGENTPSSLRMPTQGGSPPQVRGKPNSML